MNSRHRPTHRRQKKIFRPSSLNPTHHPDAVGIDVGAAEPVAVVPPDRGPAPHVRTDSAFTAGLHARRDRLLARKITTVAMESTGNYGLCACVILEDDGIVACFVNPRHVKGVPTSRPTCAPPPGCYAAASSPAKKSGDLGGVPGSSGGVLRILASC